MTHLLQLLSPLSPHQTIIHRLNEMGNRQGDQEERLDAFMRQIAEMQKTLRKLQNESGEQKTQRRGFSLSAVRRKGDLS